jgi:hypothetical protein
LIAEAACGGAPPDADGAETSGSTDPGRTAGALDAFDHLDFVCDGPSTVVAVARASAALPPSLAVWRRGAPSMTSLVGGGSEPTSGAGSTYWSFVPAGAEPWVVRRFNLLDPDTGLLLQGGKYQAGNPDAGWASCRNPPFAIVQCLMEGRSIYITEAGSSIAYEEYALAAESPTLTLSGGHVEAGAPGAELQFTFPEGAGSRALTVFSSKARAASGVLVTTPAAGPAQSARCNVTTVEAGLCSSCSP